jgi:hypothetical protein
MTKESENTNMPKKSENIGINIGAAKGSVQEARFAINDILQAQVDQSTKVEALKTLRELCAVSNTVVSNCSISV